MLKVLHHTIHHPKKKSKGQTLSIVDSLNVQFEVANNRAVGLNFEKLFG